MAMRRLFTISSVLALLSFFTVHAFAAEIASESIGQTTVRGRLQKTVEPGGWLVVDGAQKYLLINAQQFKNESWFDEGTAVEAVGETREVMTVYMEGTPFEVKSLRPARSARYAGDRFRRLDCASPA
jgi:hypothetical protein